MPNVPNLPKTKIDDTFPLELALIRHGESTFNRDGTGGTDSPLTDLGIEQARRLAHWLAANRAAGRRVYRRNQSGRNAATANADAVLRGNSDKVLPELVELLKRKVGKWKTMS